MAILHIFLSYQLEQIYQLQISFYLYNYNQYHFNPIIFRFEFIKIYQININQKNRYKLLIIEKIDKLLEKQQVIRKINKLLEEFIFEELKTQQKRRGIKQMLKQSNPQSSKQQRIVQSVLKHKVRNLRAKVQSLLPIQQCMKIQKRNNRLKKQYFKRQQMQHHRQLSQTSNSWKYSYATPNRLSNQQRIYESSLMSKTLNNSIHQQNKMEKQNQYIRNNDQRYNPKSKNEHKQIYHFQKLTLEQLQQISQDKLYYLESQHHVQAYNNYVAQKHRQHNFLSITEQTYKSKSKTALSNKNLNKLQNYKSNKSLQSSFQQSISQENNINDQKQNKIWFNNKQKHQRQVSSMVKGSYNNLISLNDLSSNISSNRNSPSRPFSTLVQQNQLRLKQQSTMKNILLSMQIKTKQQKVAEQLQKLRHQKIQDILKTNKLEEIKIVTAQQKKRKIYNQVGQIVSMTQKLRKQCIHKKYQRSYTNDQPEIHYVFNQSISHQLNQSISHQFNQFIAHQFNQPISHQLNSQ